MEENERYELQEVFEDGSFCWYLKDNDTKLLKPLVSLHNCVDLLNQQDKQIKELQLLLYADNKMKNNSLNGFKKLKQKNLQLKQSQNQKAIEELRHIKENILINDEYDEEVGCNIIKTFDLLEDIRDRIRELGGE